MRTCQVVSLLLVASAVALVLTLRAGEQRAAPPEAFVAADGADGDACACELPASMAQTTAPPQIPPVPGLPTVIEFGSDRCDECREMQELLADLGPRLQDRAGVLTLDTDVYPLQARDWRLRMVPTQVFLDAGGEEVSRHEGALCADELLAQLRLAGAEIE